MLRAADRRRIRPGLRGGLAGPCRRWRAGSEIWRVSSLFLTRCGVHS